MLFICNVLVIYLCFPQKDLAPFFYIGPIKKTSLEWRKACSFHSWTRL